MRKRGEGELVSSYRTKPVASRISPTRFGSGSAPSTEIITCAAPRPVIHRTKWALTNGSRFQVPGGIES